jgi:hypothetical protein
LWKFLQAEQAKQPFFDLLLKNGCFGVFWFDCDVSLNIGVDIEVDITNDVDIDIGVDN